MNLQKILVRNFITGSYIHLQDYSPFRHTDSIA